MFCPKIFSLDVPFNIVVGARYDCSFDCASSQLLEVNILSCLRLHFEYVEELFLLKLNQLLELSCSHLLEVSSHMIYSLARYQNLLFRKSFKILYLWHFLLFLGWFLVLKVLFTNCSRFFVLLLCSDRSVVVSC